VRTSPRTVANERRSPRPRPARRASPRLPCRKIIEGRVNGFFKENVLLEQAFAKDQKKSVAQVLKEAGAEARGFARFRVGN
jgi:elongation factor Ts